MDKLTMSAKERRRVEVLSRVRDGQLSVSVAAGLLGVSQRQAWRLKRRYGAGGDDGLVHGLRGRASNNKTVDASRSAVLKLYRAKYAGFGATLACEYLAKEGHAVSHDALGRWLRAEGRCGGAWLTDTSKAMKPPDISKAIGQPFEPSAFLGVQPDDILLHAEAP
jgi:transposase